MRRNTHTYNIDSIKDKKQLQNVAAAVESGRVPDRSQVQGSTFRVKDKEGIEDPKSPLKMLIFPSKRNTRRWCRTCTIY
jgi:hypothetical protein